VILRRAIWYNTGLWQTDTRPQHILR